MVASGLSTTMYCPFIGSPAAQHLQSFAACSIRAPPILKVFSPSDDNDEDDDTDVVVWAGWRDDVGDDDVGDDDVGDDDVGDDDVGDDGLSPPVFTVSECSVRDHQYSRYFAI